MNQDAHKAIVQQYFEIWNTGNADLADSVLAANYVDHAHPEVSSLEQFKLSVQRVRRAVPDFYITLEMMISEGDLVSVRGTIRRTQQGRLNVSHVIWFVRVSNGKMAELWTGVEATEQADTRAAS